MSKLIIIFSICTTLIGCTSRTKKTVNPPNWPPHLHGYADFEQCPPYVIRGYDEAKVKKLAEQAGMRPVDYLHRMNNKRYKRMIK